MFSKEPKGSVDGISSNNNKKFNVQLSTSKSTKNADKSYIFFILWLIIDKQIEHKYVQAALYFQHLTCRAV